MKENKYRTHTCEQLRITDAGKEVRLSGWVNSIRRLGGITFLTLRDNYGVTQILVRDENLLEGIIKESVVKVEGKVVERESRGFRRSTNKRGIKA